MNIGIGEKQAVELPPVTWALDKANKLIDDISNNRFSEVINSARDKDVLDKLGIMLTPNPWSLAIREPLSTKNSIHEALNLIARHSTVDFGRFLEDTKKRRPILELAGYVVVTHGYEPPTDFLKGVAEIYLEEWLHIAQELLSDEGKDLSLTGLSQDPEIDVAIYLVKKGYRPSDYFLDRNGRREKLKELKLI